MDVPHALIAPSLPPFHPPTFLPYAWLCQWPSTTTRPLQVHVRPYAISISRNKCMHKNYGTMGRQRPVLRLDEPDSYD